MDELLTVAQVARIAGLSNTSVRNWTAEFADYLTEHANPPEKGTERRFTKEDVAVILTAAVMRDQLQSYEAIKRALDEGIRLEPPRLERERQAMEDETTAAESPRALAAVNALEAALTTQTNRIVVLEHRVDELTDRLIDAEKRAAIAEAKLEASQQGGRRQSFLEWLRGR